MDKRYPDALRFSSTTEMRERAERIADEYLNGTDDAPAFAAGDIAGYQRPHSMALAAHVYATLDPADRNAFESILSRVAFGSYRSVMSMWRDPGDGPEQGLRREVEWEARTAIDLLARNVGERLRDGTDDAYAAAARTIRPMSVEFGILVTFIICSVLDGTHLSIRRLQKPPADGRRQVERFVAFLEQFAMDSERSGKPGP